MTFSVVCAPLNASSIFVPENALALARAKAKAPNHSKNSFDLFNPFEAFCCDDCTPELKPKKTVNVPTVKLGDTMSEIRRDSSLPSYAEEQRRITEQRRKRYNRPKKGNKKKERKQMLSRDRKKNKYLKSQIKRKMLNRQNMGNWSCCGGPWDKPEAARMARRMRKERSKKWNRYLNPQPAENFSMSRREAFARISDRCSSLRRPVCVGI